MCRRWRAVGNSSPMLWDAVGWAGSGDPALQVASLRSFLAWLSSRAPPCELRLHLVLEMPFYQQSAGPCAETWALLGAVVAQCAPRLQQLTILQASWGAVRGRGYPPASSVPARHFTAAQPCPARAHCSALLTRMQCRTTRECCLAWRS